MVPIVFRRSFVDGTSDYRISLNGLMMRPFSRSCMNVGMFGGLSRAMSWLCVVKGPISSSVSLAMSATISLIIDSLFGQVHR